MNYAEIAKDEGVSADAIRQSVHQVEVYRSKNTAEEMELACRDLLISVIPQAKETLAGLLSATELVERKNAKTGRTTVVKMDDKTTRLEALRVLNSLASNLQPKTPMVQTNVIQTNENSATSGSETNEERFRRLRKKAAEHNLLPPEVAAVPGYIDADEDAPDDDDEEDDETEEEDDGA